MTSARLFLDEDGLAIRRCERVEKLEAGLSIGTSTAEWTSPCNSPLATTRRADCMILEHFRRISRLVLVISLTSWPLLTVSKLSMEWRTTGAIETLGLKREGKRAR